ncbi:YutD-like domain-containing protein [Bacillus piscicola]|uniref:YutD-like domain-containing protein n=1 Tax=Bacillus piscicola TaxID=1632684 RepID=UPI001F091BF8
MIQVQSQRFELVNDVRNGWDEEEFKNRYSDILNKYDFVVGDWSHNQLRLRGFFANTRKKASFDTKIETLEDYIYEYCSFGCAYFVLKKVRPAE